MNSTLRHGRFTVPQSFEAAQKRHGQLSHEIVTIKAQLSDDTRHRRYPNQDAYLDWRLSAHQALAVFTSELRMLDEWMARETEASKLLRDAYDFLNKAEIEWQFSKAGTDLMTRLDAYFSDEEVPDEDRRS